MNCEKFRPEQMNPADQVNPTDQANQCEGFQTKKHNPALTLPERPHPSSPEGSNPPFIDGVPSLI